MSDISGPAPAVSGAAPAVAGEIPDPGDARAAIEYCYERGWTDGLPVVPCTEELLEEFLATTGRDPDEVVMQMSHLNRRCTVRLAAINAAMAGCRPEYFPVVLAAFAALTAEGYAPKGLWQSTTGTAPCLLVNGPVRERIGLNSRGNVFGSGVRANATIGRAIRLVGLNAFGVRPHELDQATQGTPAKYTCCFAENEEQSPWQPFHIDRGFAPGDSTVTALTMRSALHIEARHTADPEHLLRDIAGSIARTGALIHGTISACVVLSPEHAAMLHQAGWTKDDIRRRLVDEAVNSRRDLDRVGKGAVSRETRWRLPVEHPDAVIDTEHERADGSVRALGAPDAVLVAVAGAANAGVSTVIETFGPRGGRPAIARVAPAGAT